MADSACSSQECPSPKTSPMAQQRLAVDSMVHPEVVVAVVTMAAEAVAVPIPHASFQASQLGAFERTATSSTRLAPI